MNCVDCHGPAKRGLRCPSCAIAYARANRGPVRRKSPSRDAVRAEAAALPAKLMDFVLGHAP